MKAGGAEYALRLCERLAQAGSQVSVITSRIEGVATAPGVSVFPEMRHWSWWELSGLLDRICRLRPDVVNLHFTGDIYRGQPMVTFLPTLIKRRIPGVRFVTLFEHTAGVYPSRRRPFPLVAREIVARCLGAQKLTGGYGTLLRDSDAVIVLSDAHRAVFSRHYDGLDPKCVLIPPPPLLPMRAEDGGAARRHGREKLGISDDTFLVAYYGYLYPGKGIETLLRAVAMAPTGLRVVLIGGTNEVALRVLNRPDYLAELKGLAGELGVQDRLLWSGYYPSGSDVASLYLRAADACVLPFDGGVYLNNSSFAAAAAHGLPIITTEGEMLESPFLEGDNVLLCPPQNPGALAAAMTCLHEDRVLRQRLAQGALRLAAEWFSWDRTVDRTLECFRGGEASGAADPDASARPRVATRTRGG
jgi:glycosyltransferase involved in cell wall biosynthesis